MDRAGWRAAITPEARLSAFFFTQFLGAGVANSFAGLWFSGKGLSEREIGIVAATPFLVMLVLNLVVGRLADRASDWRQVIVGGALIAGLMPWGLFVVNDFWGILLVWTLGLSAQMAVTPVADAAAIRLCRRRGSNYGAVRAWGTVGYLLIIAATGYLLVWFGGAIFLPLYVAMAALRGLAAMGLPNLRAQPGEQADRRGAADLRQVMRAWFLLPIMGWAVINGTNYVLNAFQALLWKRQGIGEDTIGLLIALGAVVETIMFVGFRRLAPRWSARVLLLVAAGAGVVRWIGMSFSPDVPVLVVLQCLHAFNYALGFLAAVTFIANETSEDIAAEAQSFLVMAQQGMAFLCFTGFGWLVGHVGAKAYLASAVVAAIGGAMVLASFAIARPEATARREKP